MNNEEKIQKLQAALMQATAMVCSMGEAMGVDPENTMLEVHGVGKHKLPPQRLSSLILEWRELFEVGITISHGIAQSKS